MLSAQERPPQAYEAHACRRHGSMKLRHGRTRKLTSSDTRDERSVALLVQLYLSLDRLDLAKQTYASAKVWAEDSLIIQLCEAWIGLKQGGEEDISYQSAFYCYDEISQGPSANNPTVLNGKAVSQAALHRWPEAEAPLTEAAGIDSNHAATLANSAAIALLSGKPAGTSEQYLS